MMMIMATGKSHIPARAGTADEAVFEVLITPHRSLGPRGFRTLMALVCIVATVSSVPFVLLGAWPVAGFFGLDLLALYIAFRVNFRDGRAFEEIILTRIELLLRKVTPTGTAREWHFNPAWTRLHRDTDPEFGVQRLALVSRGQSVVVGQALSPDERASLADALGGALAEARRG